MKNLRQRDYSIIHGISPARPAKFVKTYMLYDHPQKTFYSHHQIQCYYNKRNSPLYKVEGHIRRREVSRCPIRKLRTILCTCKPCIRVLCAVAKRCVLETEKSSKPSLSPLAQKLGNRTLHTKPSWAARFSRALVCVYLPRRSRDSSSSTVCLESFAPTLVDEIDFLFFLTETNSSACLATYCLPP